MNSLSYCHKKLLFIFCFSQVFSLGIECWDDLFGFLPALKMSLYHLLACTVFDEKCCSFVCKVSFFPLSSSTTLSLIHSFLNMMHQDVSFLLFCSAWGLYTILAIWKTGAKSQVCEDTFFSQLYNSVAGKQWQIKNLLKILSFTKAPRIMLNGPNQHF